MVETNIPTVLGIVRRAAVGVWDRGAALERPGSGGGSPAFTHEYTEVLTRGSVQCRRLGRVGDAWSTTEAYVGD